MRATIGPREWTEHDTTRTVVFEHSHDTVIGHGIVWKTVAVVTLRNLDAWPAELSRRR